MHMHVIEYKHHIAIYKIVHTTVAIARVALCAAIM